MEGLRILGSGSLLLIVASITACTGQLPGSFRFAQQEEDFSSIDVNTRLDILWVIDNSGSMANEQVKIRDGFVSFAQKYMKPAWDIRLAVITTDTYLAHTALQGYLDGTVSGSGNYASNYVNGITASGIPGRFNYQNNPNPSWGTLFNWDPGTSKWRTPAGGLTNKQIRPNLGRSWAKLLNQDPVTGKGNHDGPAVLTCFEKDPSSSGNALQNSRCDVRDNISRPSPIVNTGVSHCVSPGSGESAVSECINTGLNDSVHSGKSIISTLGSNESQLISDFVVNATVGIQGNGAEEGINSLLQLIADNEVDNSPTKFFRADALRVIVFVSDEEDGSVVYPTNGTQVTPNQYFTSGAPCQKTVGGYTYTIGQCINPSIAYPNVGAGMPIGVVKNQLDTFFRTLDGDPSGDPNYFVATITALTAATVQQSGDQGTRYIQLGQAVGNGSLALEIESTDYAPLLNAIGNVVVEKKAVFTLKRESTGEEDMIVKVKHEDGNYDVISGSKYSVLGKVLTITDQDTVLSLKSTDRIQVSYQPKTVY